MHFVVQCTLLPGEALRSMLRDMLVLLLSHWMNGWEDQRSFLSTLPLSFFCSFLLFFPKCSQCSLRIETVMYFASLLI